jgi:membrane protease YdiL (CAAX protease family)
LSTEKLNVNDEYKKWGLFGTIVWGLIIALIFLVIQLFTSGIYIGFTSGTVSASEYQKLMTDLQYNGAVFSINTFASLLVCGSIIIGIIKLKKGSNLIDYLGLKGVGFKIIKYWFLILGAFIVVSDSLFALLGRPIVPEFMSTMYSSTESPWLLWIAIIVAAPILEELFFRGFLITGLKSSIIGPAGTVFFTSFIWAAIHIQYDVYVLATIFIMGFGLGIARLKTGSVLLTIGLHSFGNLVATIETIVYISQESAKN